MTEAKILLWNLGYCRGFDGSVRSYMRKWHRLFYCSDTVRSTVHDRVGTVLAEVRPDLCCLLEVHDDSSLVTAMNESFVFGDVACKYRPDDARRHLPYCRHNCNAVFSHRPLPLQRRFLSSGMKRLVHDVSLTPDCSLFLVHCSLSRRTRALQFAELRRLVATRKSAIVCGDFNALSGLDELHALTDGTGLRVMNTEPSFPSHRPKHALSLFLCTQGVAVDSCSPIPVADAVSDHLPILMNIRI